MPNRGFTLIELLVSITILAVVASIGLTMYTNSQRVARDSRRKQDLKAIQVALEVYKQNIGYYPCTTTSASSYGSSGAWELSQAGGTWVSDQASCYVSPAVPHVFNTTYINQVPSDPLSNNGNPVVTNSVYGYAYWSGPVSGGTCPSGTNQYYVLAATLENSSDPAANGTTPQYKDCSGTTISTNPNLYVITSY